MSITIENATVTVTFNGVNYHHEYVTQITIADPRVNELAVSPQGHGKGIAYRSGTTSAITADMVVRGMQPELLSLYEKAFKTQSRFDLMIVDASTNERYDLNDSLLRNNPVIQTIGTDETALDQPLRLSTPPNGFSYQGPTA